jgi:hypothetical protein
MLCTQCGAESAGPTQLCPQCGKPFGAGPANPAVFSVTATQPHTDGKAVASFILGILAFILSIFTGIPAIILGHLSRASIRRSGGGLKGDGLAITGLATGYLSVGFFLLIVPAILIPNMTRAKIVTNEHAATRTVRRITVSEMTYQTKYPNSGYAPSLAVLAPPESTCGAQPSAERACLLDKNDAELGSSLCMAGTWCNKGAYRYAVVPVGSPASDFIISATPLSENSGRTSYCVTSSGMVRSNVGEPLATPLVSVAECESWNGL